MAQNSSENLGLNSNPKLSPGVVSFDIHEAFGIDLFI